MRVLLLSGGSGQRLWPYSNPHRAKPFMGLLKNEHNERESMLQRMWRQLERADLARLTVISTDQTQIPLIDQQIGKDVTVIAEPERKDTFPAISLAAAFLDSRGVDRDEVLIVLPVDFYAEDDFFACLADLETCIRQQLANIALLGAKPQFPAEHYGYILPQNVGEPMQGPGCPVRFFVEKPAMKLAELLISQGALWNCGVFAFKLGYLLDQLAAKGLPNRLDDLMEQYASLPKSSFDFEVLEHEMSLRVIPYNGKWKDLGNWESFTSALDDPVIGLGKVSEDCANVNVINELDVPVMLVGVSNLVVAATKDGILVADKHSSHLIKEMIPAEWTAARAHAGGKDHEHSPLVDRLFTGGRGADGEGDARPVGLAETDA